jgi:outer membrane lipoprotein SlyB
VVTKHSREKCPGSLQKFQLVLVCGGRTGHSVHAFTAVRALTKESVIHSTITTISSVFISVDADGTTVVVGIAVAVDGGSTAGVPCKAYRAALWTSPKS